LVIQKLLSTRRDDVAVSVITEAELRTGAAKSSSPSKTLQLLEAFLRPLAIIAAHAVSRNLVLVSNNEREFRRVAELRVENWAGR